MMEDLTCFLRLRMLILLETHIPDIQDYINGMLTNLEHLGVMGRHLRQSNEEGLISESKPLLVRRLPFVL